MKTGKNLEFLHFFPMKQVAEKKKKKKEEDISAWQLCLRRTEEKSSHHLQICKHVLKCATFSEKRA